MKYELAESILSNVMDHWDPSRMSEETKDIQIISEIKYDDYQQFTHGMRYVESLALWMRQFDNVDDKELAYDMVKNKLVYISEEEMRQLVTYAYPIAMKKYLMKMTKDFCDSKNVSSIPDRKKVVRYFERCSMFLGLSDGAHIDYFRRQNLSLSNEQVFVHYDFSETKAKDMKKSLNEDIEIANFHKQYKILDEENFTSFFLIDDFTGSGKSYIRKDNKEWHGKIHKFFQGLKKLEYDINSVNVHLVLYVATEKSINYISQECSKYAKENGTKLITIDTIQIIKPINWDENIQLKDLLKRDFEVHNSNCKVSYVDKHFEVGEGKEPYLGFADCSLPLVLYHNTPNNTLPILWYLWEDQINALFLRITRHKEI